MVCRATPRRSAAMRPHEVVLVTSVILLSAVVLVPAIGESKQRGSIAVCLANLRTLGVASGYYFDDHTDFPFAMPFGYRAAREYRFNVGLATEFIYGGGMPDKTFTDYQLAGLSSPGSSNPGSTSTPADVNAYPPRFRALNPHVEPRVSWDDGTRAPQRSSNNPRTQLPMQLPDVFKCPADNSPEVPTLQVTPQPAPGAVAALSRFSRPTWQYWGTSYAANWYWAVGYATAVGSGGTGLPPVYVDAANVLGLYQGFTNGVPGLSGYMFSRDASGDWMSRFVLLMEGRMNVALKGARPCDYPGSPPFSNYTGWHGELNGHAALHADGHATYDYRDTHFVEGDGWSVWPQRPWLGNLSRYGECDEGDFGVEGP